MLTAVFKRFYGTPLCDRLLKVRVFACVPGVRGRMWDDVLVWGAASMLRCAGWACMHMYACLQHALLFPHTPTPPTPTPSPPLQTLLLYFTAMFQMEWVAKSMERSRKHLEG